MSNNKLVKLLLRVLAIGLQTSVFFIDDIHAKYRIINAAIICWAVSTFFEKN